MSPVDDTVMDGDNCSGLFASPCDAEEASGDHMPVLGRLDSGPSRVPDSSSHKGRTRCSRRERDFNFFLLVLTRNSLMGSYGFKLWECMHEALRSREADRETEGEAE